MDGGTSNDNRQLDSGILDPDRHYVDDYMAKACRHFRECGFNRETVAYAMLTELFKMLEGNPFRSPADEGALRGDQQFLWGMKHRIVPMSEQWDKGWVRAQYEKRPTYKFNRAAPRPMPALPPRLVMPLPHVGQNEFLSALRRLGLRKGHVYTDNEIIARYKRRLDKAMKDKADDRRLSRAKKLTFDKKHILAFFREHRHLAKAQDAD